MPHQGSAREDFSAEVSEEGGRAVVRVHGDIDIATAEPFAQCVDTALGKSPMLVIDLAETPFMDSTGLSVLVKAYRESGRVKEGIVLRSPCAAVRRTLEVSGIEEIITVEE